MAAAAGPDKTIGAHMRRATSHFSLGLPDLRRHPNALREGIYSGSSFDREREEAWTDSGRFDQRKRKPKFK